jgi:hypothetical protein
MVERRGSDIDGKIIKPPATPLETTALCAGAVVGETPTAPRGPHATRARSALAKVLGKVSRRGWGAVSAVSQMREIGGGRRDSNSEGPRGPVDFK